MTEAKPTPYSNIIHYISEEYEESGNCYLDLQEIFKAWPWCNPETPFNTMVWHLMECWRTVRGKAEIKEHVILSLLTEDLNPQSILNQFIGNYEYKQRVVSALLGKIATTEKVDKDGNPNFTLAPIDEDLRNSLAALNRSRSNAEPSD